MELSDTKLDFLHVLEKTDMCRCGWFCIMANANISLEINTVFSQIYMYIFLVILIKYIKLYLTKKNIKKKRNDNMKVCSLNTHWTVNLLTFNKYYLSYQGFHYLFQNLEVWDYQVSEIGSHSISLKKEKI